MILSVALHWCIVFASFWLRSGGKIERCGGLNVVLGQRLAFRETKRLVRCVVAAQMVAKERPGLPAATRADCVIRAGSGYLDGVVFGGSIRRHPQLASGLPAASQHA